MPAAAGSAPAQRITSALYVSRIGAVAAVSRTGSVAAQDRGPAMDAPPATVSDDGVLDFSTAVASGLAAAVL